MVKKSAKEEKPQPSDPEADEKRRLRSLAFSKKLLRRGGPSKPASPLDPSNAVVKLEGRDIVKRGQRKGRFLFSFPGLLAPVSGGRVGELADLATKNPILYLEFPQGRMKLFGTHVYPKNKYLTLQLTRSSKGVMCEDIFESLIVFSEAWWIGLKEENPEELQLEFPKGFNDGKCVADNDFKGGAGALSEDTSSANNPVKDCMEPLSPAADLVDTPEDSYGKSKKNMKNVTEVVSVRQSARTAGKQLSYADPSSGDDSAASDAEVAAELDEKSNCSNGKASTSSSLGKIKGFNQATPNNLVSNISLANEKSHSTETIEQSSVALKNEENLTNKMGPLVQATLSDMFEKVVDKRSKSSRKASSGPKGPASKRQRSNSKQVPTESQAKGSTMKQSRASRKKSGKGTLRKQKSQVEDDEIEDISSNSQDDSDEDWAA
ncbi:DNA-binding protein RHL1 isoform X1 [Typha angustifolia]|uniref:DNA-binding protein RHL1 isoform X1 n=1 Tax=Typha angustifolia TaxID=59011 RepID=UPI003C30B381